MPGLRHLGRRHGSAAIALELTQVAAQRAVFFGDLRPDLLQPIVTKQFGHVGEELTFLVVEMGGHLFAQERQPMLERLVVQPEVPQFLDQPPQGTG